MNICGEKMKWVVVNMCTQVDITHIVKREQKQK